MNNDSWAKQVCNKFLIGFVLPSLFDRASRCSKWKCKRRANIKKKSKNNQNMYSAYNPVPNTQHTANYRIKRKNEEMKSIVRCSSVNMQTFKRLLLLLWATTVSSRRVYSWNSCIVWNTCVCSSFTSSTLLLLVTPKNLTF